jgi:hypothetical protein
VNTWFARVVYERDVWDLKLEEWSQRGDVRVQMVLTGCRLGVWLSRRVLKSLMTGGLVISGFLSRQMEYDADSYEVQLAGSDAFVSTMQRLRQLHVAARDCSRDLGSGLAHRTLPPDLPYLIVTRLGQLPAEMLAAAAEIPAQTSSYLDTHPRDGDRHAAAVSAGEVGILVGGEQPAASLFRSFAALSERASRHYYEHQLGLASFRPLAFGLVPPGASD